MFPVTDGEAPSSGRLSQPSLWALPPSPHLLNYYLPPPPPPTHREAVEPAWSWDISISAAAPHRRSPGRCPPAAVQTKVTRSARALTCACCGRLRVLSGCESEASHLFSLLISCCCHRSGCHRRTRNRTDAEDRRWIKPARIRRMKLFFLLSFWCSLFCVFTWTFTV